MRLVQAAGALADPGPVGGGQQRAVPVVADLGQLVVQDQRLVAGPGLGHRVRGGVGRPAQVPHGLAGGLVARDQPLRVGAAQCGVGLRGVDDVAAVDRQLPAADGLGGAGAGLGELPGDPPGPHHGQVGVHLHDPAEHVDESGLAQGAAGEAVGGVLGAVPGLEHQGGTGGGAGEQGAQAQHVAAAHQRGERGQFGVCAVEGPGIVPVGLLKGVERSDPAQHFFVHLVAGRCSRNGGDARGARMRGPVRRFRGIPPSGARVRAPSSSRAAALPLRGGISGGEWAVPMVDSSRGPAVRQSDRHSASCRLGYVRCAGSDTGRTARARAGRTALGCPSRRTSADGRKRCPRTTAGTTRKAGGNWSAS